jgi:hypothetical protein
MAVTLSTRNLSLPACRAVFAPAAMMQIYKLIQELQCAVAFPAENAFNSR